MAYERATGVIAASYGEGFGLPIVEARRHGKPVLARDIPVFREVADRSASFFTSDDRGKLAEQIAAWLKSAPSTPFSDNQSRIVTWQRSAIALIEKLPGR